MSVTLDDNGVEVLGQLPAVLRALVSERDALRDKVASYEKEEVAVEIVEEMDRKGLSDPDMTRREKVDALLSSGKDLGVVKEALALQTSNFSSFSVSADSNSDDIITERDLLDTILEG